MVYTFISKYKLKHIPSGDLKYEYGHIVLIPCFVIVYQFEYSGEMLFIDLKLRDQGHIMEMCNHAETLHQIFLQIFILMFT